MCEMIIAGCTKVLISDSVLKAVIALTCSSYEMDR